MTISSAAGKCFKVGTLCKVIVTEKTVLPQLMGLGWCTVATGKITLRLSKIKDD